MIRSELHILKVKKKKKLQKGNREKRAGCTPRQKNEEKRKKWRDRWTDVVTENREVKEGG